MTKLATDSAQSPLPFAGAPRARARPRPRVAAFALALTVATGALVSLWTGTAAAQSITITGNYPLRKVGGANSTRLPRSDDDYAGNAGINRADCDSDETWQWSFNVPAAASYTFFDVWASGSNASCADVTARAATPPGTQQPSATCWRVARFAYNQVINQGVVTTKTSDIVKAAFRLQNDDDPATTSSKEICYPTADQQPTRIYLHFLLIGSDGLTTAPDASTYESVFDTTYDLMGPPPPADVRLSAGPSSLFAQFTGATAQDKDFREYRAYCFPKRGSVTPTPDAGTGDVGAPDAASAPTCPPLPAGFAMGSLPTSDLEAFSCSSTGSTAGVLKIDGLTAGASYAVAIAALDGYGNSGLLSNVACLAPNAGAPAAAVSGGGSSCAYGPGSGAGALAALGALVACAFVARRRRFVKG
jgi:hypothetical protein